MARLLKKALTALTVSTLMVSFQAAVAQSAANTSTPQDNLAPKIKGFQEDKPVWDRSTTFGPVPKNLQKVGNAECKKANYDRAIGYSNTAQSPDGSNFEKGAFLCESDAKNSS